MAKESFMKKALPIFTFLICLTASYSLQAQFIRPNQSSQYSTIEENDQIQFDHAPESTYLYPQAFSNKQNDITAIKLKVCVEWTEGSPAIFDDNVQFLRSGRSITDTVYVPYRFPTQPHRKSYVKYAQPPVCRRFETVVIATSEAILRNIERQVLSVSSSLNLSLARIDSDLNERIKKISQSDSLKLLQTDMEARVKKDILNGPLALEIKQQIYEELKAELQQEKCSK